MKGTHMDTTIRSRWVVTYDPGDGIRTLIAFGLNRNQAIEDAGRRLPGSTRIISVTLDSDPRPHRRRIA